MKQTQKASVKATNAAIRKAALEQVNKGGPSPLISGTMENIGKPGKGKVKVPAGKAVKSHEADGTLDAQKLFTAQGRYDETRVEIIRGLAWTAKLGMAPKVNTKDKTQKFHAETETYFRGMEAFRLKLSESDEATARGFRVRISEVRRWVRAYITEGIEAVHARLDAAGSFAAKTADLPKSSAAGRPTGQTEGKSDKSKGSAVNAALKAAEAEQRTTLIRAWGIDEAGQLVAALTDEQLPIFIRALALRAAASKNKMLHDVGEKVAKIAESMDKATKMEQQRNIADSEAKKAANQ